MFSSSQNLRTISFHAYSVIVFIINLKYLFQHIDQLMHMLEMWCAYYLHVTSTYVYGITEISITSQSHISICLVLLRNF